MKKLKIFTLMLSLMLLFSGCGTITTIDNDITITPTTITSVKGNSESNISSNVTIIEIPSTTYDS